MEAIILALLPAVPALVGVWLGSKMSRRQAIETLENQRNIEQVKATRKAIADTKFVVNEANPRRFHMSFNKEASPALLEEWETSWKATQRDLIYADVELPPEFRGKNGPLGRLESKVTWLFHWLKWLSRDMQDGTGEIEMSQKAIECYEESLDIIEESINVLDEISQRSQRVGTWRRLMKAKKNKEIDQGS